MALKKFVDGNAVVFELSGFPQLRLEMSSLSAPIRTRAAYHGLLQKVGDAAAGKSGSDAYEAMEAVIEHLEQAATEEDWNRKPTGDGSGSAGLLVRALVELTGRPIDTVRAEVKALSKAEQAALRASEPVAPVIARLRKPATVAPETAAKASAFLSALMGKGSITTE